MGLNVPKNIVKIEDFEKKQIVEKITDKLRHAMEDFGINSSSLSDSLEKTNMYYADFEDTSKAVYSYICNSIYFSKDTNFEKISSNILHEIIHYLQAEVSNNKTIKRMGLFKFSRLFKKDFGLRT